MNLNEQEKLQFFFNNRGKYIKGPSDFSVSTVKIINKQNNISNEIKKMVKDFLTNINFSICLERGQNKYGIYGYDSCLSRVIELIESKLIDKDQYPYGIGYSRIIDNENEICKLKGKSFKKYIEKYLSKFKETMEYTFPIFIEGEDERKYFLNLIKTILFFSMTKYKLEIDDDYVKSHFKHEYSEGFIKLADFFNYHNQCIESMTKMYTSNFSNEINCILDILNNKKKVNYLGEEKYLDELLMLVLEDKIKEYNSYKCIDNKFNYQDAFELKYDVLTVAKNIVTTIYLLIESVIYKPKTHLSTDEDSIDNSEKDKKNSNNVENLLEQLDVAKKRIAAYQKTMGNIQNFGNTSKVVDNNKVLELERQIKRQDETIKTLERENEKIGCKFKKSVEENESLRKEIKLLLPDENEIIPILENNIIEIDFEAKYAFILQSRSKLEIEDELKKAFPNSQIINTTKQLNNTYDLAIFLTDFMSHHLYIQTKKNCKELKIPYIHCPNINIEKIKQYIWSYYNS